MTRKTALLLAIQALSEDKNNKEICDVLQQIAEDLPIAHWNKTSIIDSVQQFIEDHDRLPLSREFDTNSKLPVHLLVKKHFNMNVTKFKEMYFKEQYQKDLNKHSAPEEIQKWREIFVSEYTRIGNPCFSTFRIQRKEGIPHPQYIIKLCGCSTWEELVTSCGFTPETKKSRYLRKVAKQKERVKYSVVYSDFDTKNLKEINKKIKAILE